jgi:hypothetical protein
MECWLCFVKLNRRVKPRAAALGNSSRPGPRRLERRVRRRPNEAGPLARPPEELAALEDANGELLGDITQLLLKRKARRLVLWLPPFATGSQPLCS